MLNNMIEFHDFEKVQIRVGKIIKAINNEKAKIPAYILTIDFGLELGIKISSAQLTQNYTLDDLVDRKICAVTNFPAKRVAGVKSEVLVLASVCDKRGAFLVKADDDSQLGSRVI